MLRRIHHVGVVVPSLEEGLRFWRDVLGMLRQQAGSGIALSISAHHLGGFTRTRAG